MRAFITGVTGFAGSHLAEHLLRQGDVVAGCTRRGRWDASLPVSVTSRIPVFAWNLADGVTPQIHQKVAAFQPDIIYHLAAVSVPADCGDSEPTPQAVATNIDGTSSIVDLPSQPRPADAASGRSSSGP